VIGSSDTRSGRKRNPGPKPGGRKVAPLTVTIPPAQKAALEALADERGCSISEIVRQFVADGLAAAVTGSPKSDAC
jgi:hypothetical protein